MSNYLWVSDLYTPLSQALEDLSHRRRDPALVEKVRQYFLRCPSFPEMAEHPRAVMSPPIFTPNLESISFEDITQYLPLEPLVCEYSQDKFVHLNIQKKCLGHMTFMRKNALDEKQAVTESIRVVDFNRWQGKPMNQVSTLWGESLTEFHHRIAESFFSERHARMEVIDFSEWYRSSKNFDDKYPYLRFLGLFLTEGILFANFTTGKWEREFTDEIVFPAFRRLEEIFGIRPLITPLEPMETDDLAFWCYYPEKVKELVGDHGI